MFGARSDAAESLTVPEVADAFDVSRWTTLARSPSSFRISPSKRARITTSFSWRQTTDDAMSYRSARSSTVSVVTSQVMGWPV